MKIIEITKHSRSSTGIHFLVLNDESYSNDDIDYLVEEWCDKDPGGANTGYTYEWKFVTNKKTIEKTIIDKIKTLKIKRDNITTNISELEKHLN